MLIWRPLAQTNHQVAQGSRPSAQMAPTGWNLESNGRVMAQTGANWRNILKQARWHLAHAIWHPVYSTWRHTCRADINSAPQRATTRQSHNLWRELAPTGAGPVDSTLFFRILRSVGRGQHNNNKKLALGWRLNLFTWNLSMHRQQYLVRMYCLLYILQGMFPHLNMLHLIGVIYSRLISKLFAI